MDSFPPLRQVSRIFLKEACLHICQPETRNIIVLSANAPSSLEPVSSFASNPNQKRTTLNQLGKDSNQ
ncbi:uncharacterized protein METZ01_LOCUS224232 [marine metagenome]|uniref:Uncharacterized protein n=1 Tax=marine metagenome TaxID=408172 RepID=A0A382G825_9ZZZZ